MKLLRKIQALILVRRQMKVVGMALNIIRKATTMKEVKRPISVLKQLAASKGHPLARRFLQARYETN